MSLPVFHVQHHGECSNLSFSLSRFPGFSKSGPELYLLSKQVAKGKEKLTIYVGYLQISIPPILVISVVVTAVKFSFAWFPLFASVNLCFFMP